MMYMRRCSRCFSSKTISAKQDILFFFSVFAKFNFLTNLKRYVVHKMLIISLPPNYLSLTSVSFNADKNLF